MKNCIGADPEEVFGNSNIEKTVILQIVRFKYRNDKGLTCMTKNLDEGLITLFSFRVCQYCKQRGYVLILYSDVSLANLFGHLSLQESKMKLVYQLV